ncbi:hypothetical protein [Clostridium tagluense]|uniref:hypothetical protein n=1 Tax=Clostridium tagluense TaxID=360422 RepID=UPI001CF349CA|nr:hypothetical protein [Clostridium tagluense]MCB2300644.1 hypothetical protein [Clostridium tagluense]
MLYKICSICNEKVEYGKECKNGCSKKAKAITEKYYDKNIRQHANVYANKIWHQLRERCKSKFNGLDIYSFYILGAIVYGSLSHHVETVEDNIDRCYDLDNLLYVSRDTHDRIIHPAYNRSDRDKKDMQGLLFGLIKRWEEDYCE